jgi:hypothetical protein
MPKFSELNITVQQKGFIGDKIKINKLLNKQIYVHAFKMGDSKYEGKGDCLTLQISLNGTMHVIFTSSTVLKDQVQQVKPADFPFETIIIEENERYLFT